MVREVWFSWRQTTKDLSLRFYTDSETALLLREARWEPITIPPQQMLVIALFVTGIEWVTGQG